MDEICREEIKDSTQPESDSFAESILQKEDASAMPWKRHGGYKIRVFIKEFFCYKSRVIKVKDLNLEDTVKNLLESTIGDPTKDILDKCKELLQHQRMLEDTRARRRLEKWATRVISWYLILVCIVLIINGVSSAFIRYFCLQRGVAELKDVGFISDTIMIAILSTTTVNIIGLGLIVLQGHFPHKNKPKAEDE